MTKDKESDTRPLPRLLSALREASRMAAAWLFGSRGWKGLWVWIKAAALQRAGLFDPAWYLETYPDVKEAGVDPAEHYVRHGLKEGRLPMAPDMRGNAVRPNVVLLVHYLKWSVHYLKWGLRHLKSTKEEDGIKNTAPIAIGRSIDNLPALSALARHRSVTLLSPWHVAAVRSVRNLSEIGPLPAVTISVVLYNSAKWLPTFLESILRSTYPLRSIDLIFVDHGSTDETFKSLQEFSDQHSGLFRNVAVLTRKNDGYGSGNDAAIRMSNTEFVLVTNVDVEFHPNMLAILVQVALIDESRIACWEPMQVPFEHPKFYDPVTLQTNWCSHACILFRRQAYLEAGGYETRLFMYGEDVELSYRFRALGCLLRYVPFARIRHHIRLDDKAVRPLQLSGSLAANVLLRHRYGHDFDAEAGELLLEQLGVRSFNNETEERRTAIDCAIRTVNLYRHAFASSRLRGEAKFPFNGFDYDLVRRGALHRNETDLPDTTLPKVSIITRTMSDRCWLLREAIASVLNQTYPYIEHVVCEDRSNEAENLIKEVNRIYGTRIVYCRSDKGGRSAAGNVGLSVATGDFLLFLDDDDLLFADHIEILVQALRAAPTAAGAYSVAWTLKTDIRKATKTYTEDFPDLIQSHLKPFDRERLFVQNFAPIQAVLFKKEAYEKFGGFHEDMELLEDWNLWCRYSQLGDFIYVDKLTSLYRVPKNPADHAGRQHSLERAYDAARRRNFSDCSNP